MKNKAKTEKNIYTLPTAKAELKWYNFDDLLAKELKDKEFRKGYEQESARLALVQKIRQARQAKKMTQSAVAQKASMPQSVIARLESGDHGVSLETLSRVAHALGKRVEIV